MNNPYLELTEELNRHRLRALLSSGQAVVVHRLAIMSELARLMIDPRAQFLGTTARWRYLK